MGGCLMFVANGCWDGVMNRCIWQTLIQGCLRDSICLGCIVPTLSCNWMPACWTACGIGCTALGDAGSCMIGTVTCNYQLCSPTAWATGCQEMGDAIVGCVQGCNTNCCIPTCQGCRSILETCCTNCCEIPPWMVNTCLPNTLQGLQTCGRAIGASCTAACTQCYTNFPCSRQCMEECGAAFLNACVACPSACYNDCNPFSVECAQSCISNTGTCIYNTGCVAPCAVGSCVAGCGQSCYEGLPCNQACWDQMVVDGRQSCNTCMTGCGGVLSSIVSGCATGAVAVAANTDRAAQRARILATTTGPMRLRQATGPALQRNLTWAQMVYATRYERAVKNVQSKVATAQRYGVRSSDTSELANAFRDAARDAGEASWQTKEASEAYWRGVVDKNGDKIIEGWNDLSEAAKKEFWYDVLEAIQQDMDAGWHRRWASHGYNSYQQTMLQAAVSKGKAIVPAGKPGHVDARIRLQEKQARKTNQPVRGDATWTCRATCGNGECGNANSVKFNPKICPKCRSPRPTASINMTALGADAALDGASAQAAQFQRIKEHVADHHDGQAQELPWNGKRVMAAGDEPDLFPVQVFSSSANPKAPCTNQPARYDPINTCPK